MLSAKDRGTAIARLQGTFGCFWFRFVLQSLLYPLGISMDTLQANYSMVAGAGRVITLNR